MNSVRFLSERRTQPAKATIINFQPIDALDAEDFTHHANTPR